MDIFHYDIVGNLQIRMSKVPDGFDSGFDKTICDLRRLRLRNRKSCNLHLVILNELFQVLNSSNLHPADHQAHQARIHIEHSLDYKAPAFKVCVICNGLSQVSRTDDNQVMLPVYPKNPRYLTI